jgi:hypothetical protein
MPIDWTFYKQGPTDPISNPITGEFFSSEAIGDVTEALVREGIQNALDARASDAGHGRKRAEIRIYLSEDRQALPARKVSQWFSSLSPHLLAPGSGVRDVPSFRALCPFLVFEDFGTTGLTGATDQYTVEPDRTNNFMNFFRAEGYSNKGGDDRGSWGVGKTVFPRTSSINAFFGLTVRADDRQRLLLGHATLKYHAVGNTKFKSDGYWGVPAPNGLMMPTDDARVVDAFRDDFRIRRDMEPGLSVVVPWYDPDPEDGLSYERVVQAVASGFFYPILMGHLAVTVEAPGRSVDLTESSIADEVTPTDGIAPGIAPWVALAEWAQTRTPEEFTTLNAPASDESQKFSSALVPPDLLGLVRQSLADGNRLALRFPLFVRQRDNGPQATHFNAFIERSTDDGQKPVFVRDELIIPEVTARSLSGCRALVIVEDPPLAMLLRDAETPAHTHWTPKTANFKNKYKFGAGAIKFVQAGVYELLKLARQSDDQPDPSITVDFFSLDDESAEPAPGRPPAPRVRREGPNVTPDVPAIPPRPKRFRIHRLAGGFWIGPGDPQAATPATLEVQVAYDVRRGNPLKRYDVADFDLSDSAKHLAGSQQNVTVVSAAENRATVRIDGPEFRVTVAGFDENRDLFVRATARDDTNVQ